MGTVRTETLRRDLAHAVRTGPFSSVLSLAIESSGLKLEELQARLLDRRIHVALSTLSYWRRGRSRPERSQSLRAVAALEEILGLPGGALSAHLGPKRPRGRWLGHPAGSLDIVAEWGGDDGLGGLLQDSDTPVYNGAARLSIHDLYCVGPDRQEIQLITRQVIRAEAAEVSRAALVFRLYDRPERTPRLEAVRGCRIGRVRTDSSGEFLVADLAFERQLRHGDTTVIEYAAIGLSTVADFYHRLISRPLGEYVLQVQFDPAAVPLRCQRYERRTEGAPEQGVRDLQIGNTHLAHLVLHDVAPGLFGMRWDWG